ncbi:poly-gamma-glutamate synthesis protein (capsule biosynthesis protein) [Lachnospiraceae bacterium XBB1006]|nr:poly-gamma-glutamate synthesis protein (capsule biosynthesis protein) [Lachnospiraceae bacterium XBB1006]
MEGVLKRGLAFLTIAGMSLGALTGCVGEAKLAQAEASGDAKTVIVKAPKKVEALKTTTSSKSIVELSWKDEKASGYYVYRKEGNNAYQKITNTKKHSLRLKIKPNVAYRYKVVAYNEKEGKEARAKASIIRYRLNKIVISAAGDCTLGVDSRFNNNFNAMYDRKSPAYFLKKVKPIFSKDDITIVNFEGTLTNATTRAIKTFTFKGRKKYTEILKSSSVEVVNLANNHTMDFLEQGMRDTRKALKDANIKYCILHTVAYKKVHGTKVALLGFNGLSGVSNTVIKQTIHKAKRKGADVIVVSFHWGVEREYAPVAAQKNYAHYAIKQGANLVIGHHPHVLQGVEKYKKSYILYSMGNFCFGGNANPSDKDTMVYTQAFYVDSHGKFIENAEAKAIPCLLSGHRNYNDFQPTPAKGSTKRRILQKLRNMSKGMHVTINGKGEID